MLTFRHTTLENGLTIIGEERPTALSLSLGYFVKTGARDEGAEISGVSHFLEHMLFKGTATRSALELTYDMGAIGAQANAFTSEENTVYYMAVLPEFQERAFSILTDMMRPALRQEDFDMEKNVILEEIALYQDRPTHVLLEATLREFFGSHPAGNSVLGSTSSISALTQGQMQSYFDKAYSPTNMTLVATGAIDWQKLCDDAAQACSQWKAYDVTRPQPPFEKKASSKVLKKENLSSAHVCLATPGPAVSEDERYPLSLLCCMLGDHTGSRAYWELVDKGLSDSASVDSEEMDGVGMMYGYASAAPDKIEQVRDILAGIMKTPKNFSDDDLERAKTKIGTRLVLQGESVMRRLMAVGLEWTYEHDYTPLEEDLKRVQRITRDDIYHALERYNCEPTVSVTLMPE